MEFNLSEKNASDSDHLVIVLDETNIQQVEAYPQTEWFNKETLKKNKWIKNYKNDKCHYLVWAQAGEKAEKLRRSGAEICQDANAQKIKSLHFKAKKEHADSIAFLIEGAALANYQFLKYKTENFSKPNSLSQWTYENDLLSERQKQKISSIVNATYWSRDLVNEPLSYLTAEKLAEVLKTNGENVGIKTHIWSKETIEKEGMGGLLAVNKGSVDPPSFTIMEWKPDEAVNEKPIVLVGKGVVYDTGGLSLKPTSNSMDKMKSDMGGAAAVAGGIYSVASAKLNLWVIALIPATDNRPGLNAYVPGDVIHMHNKMTVEVLNTDAEGRMLLADALSYAQKLDPELVLDFATLTGAAARAVGPEGIVYMGNAEENERSLLKEAGDHVHERLVEFPLWEEYKKMLNSDIADIKNVGGPAAGAITAGMFLQYFTKYPWIHVDIASMAFLDSNDGYRLKNGSGVGARLLFEFLQRRTEQK